MNFHPDIDIVRTMKSSETSLSRLQAQKMAMGYPIKMDALFHGQAENKTNDLGVPLFQETSIYIYIYNHIYIII